MRPRHMCVAVALMASALTACTEVSEESCRPVMGLDLRGSGAYEGLSPAGELAQRLIGSSGVMEESQIPTPPENDLAVYEEQVRAQTEEATEWVRRTGERCGEAVLLLTGYSQGAHAVHLALSAPRGPEWRRVRALLIADPLRYPATDATYEGVGGEADGRGDLIAVQGYPPVPMRGDRDHILSLCHQEDWVCNDEAGTRSRRAHGITGQLPETYEKAEAWWIAQEAEPS